jgi:hypothetical protein
MKTKSIDRDVPHGSRPSPDRLAELQRLAAMPDDGIDTSDAAPLTAAELAEITRGRFYRKANE